MDKNQKPDMLWWREARFGMMVHFGLYAQLAGEYEGRSTEFVGEWIQSWFQIPRDKYAELAGVFNPVRFDADEWVRLALRAGMKYLIFTAKHHEGFALFRSAASRFNICDSTPFGRDIVQELAEACRKAGLKLGLYYSQSLDWHEPDAGGTDAGHQNFGMSWGNNWDFPDQGQKDFSRYMEAKVKPQLREILTQYGKIDILWFDTPLTITRQQSEELYSLVRELQPDCIINSRLGNDLGDYRSLGDNQYLAPRTDGDWETVATLNDTWGYKAADQNWKSRDEVLSILTTLAGNGINYVLNIGPKPDGSLPEPFVARLTEIGDWMALYGESVTGTMASPFAGPLPWGPVTRNKDCLFIHLHRLPENGKIQINGLSGVTGASCAGRKLSVQTELHSQTQMQSTIVDAQGLGRFAVIRLSGEAGVLPGIYEQAGTIALPITAARLYSRSGGHYVITPGLEESAQPHLSDYGFIEGYHDLDLALDFEFQVVNPGLYRLELITAAGCPHDFNPGRYAAREPHLIRAEINGCELAANLRYDRLADEIQNKYIDQAITSMGETGLQTGLNRLRLSIKERQGGNFRLYEARLTNVGKG